MARGKSTIKSGRTIAERRERLETANERMAARKKDKRKNRFRVGLTVFIFVALAGALAGLYVVFSGNENKMEVVEPAISEEYKPTIEVIDEDGAAYGGKITSRMSAYIGQAEEDFRELGYKPVRAVIPADSVREVDFYLEGYEGFIKMLIDRGSGVSVEDADRMIRYLKSEDETDFKYIDVRVEGKAFWK